MAKRKRKERDPLTSGDFSAPQIHGGTPAFTAEIAEQIRNAQLRRDWRQQRDKEDADFAKRLRDGNASGAHDDDDDDDDSDD